MENMKLSEVTLLGTRFARAAGSERESLHASDTGEGLFTGAKVRFCDVCSG